MFMLLLWLLLFSIANSVKSVSPPTIYLINTFELQMRRTRKSNTRPFLLCEVWIQGTEMELNRDLVRSRSSHIRFSARGNPSRLLISYHIISYHIISYHIISYHIVSYLAMYKKIKHEAISPLRSLDPRDRDGAESRSGS